MELKRAFLLLTVVLLISCKTKPTEEKVHIAAIIFLTGNQASLGEEINNAFQIANEIGGT